MDILNNAIDLLITLLLFIVKQSNFDQIISDMCNILMYKFLYIIIVNVIIFQLSYSKVKVSLSTPHSSIHFNVSYLENTKKCIPFQKYSCSLNQLLTHPYAVHRFLLDMRFSRHRQQNTRQVMKKDDERKVFAFHYMYNNLDVNLSKI